MLGFLRQLVFVTSLSPPLVAGSSGMCTVDEVRSLGDQSGVHFSLLGHHSVLSALSPHFSSPVVRLPPPSSSRVSVPPPVAHILPPVSSFAPHVASLANPVASLFPSVASFAAPVAFHAPVSLLLLPSPLFLILFPRYCLLSPTVPSCSYSTIAICAFPAVITCVLPFVAFLSTSVSSLFFPVSSLVPPVSPLSSFVIPSSASLTPFGFPKDLRFSSHVSAGAALLPLLPFHVRLVHGFLLACSGTNRDEYLHYSYVDDDSDKEDNGSPNVSKGDFSKAFQEMISVITGYFPQS